MDDNLYPVDSIRPDPDQPRKNKPPEYMRELAKSIAYKGLDNELHIRTDPEGEWLVVNGECRWTAISLYLPGILQEMAKTGETPTMTGWHRDEHGQMFVTAKVKEYSGENVPADVFLDQIRDNEVRQNLGKIETLEAFKRAAEEFSIPLDEMANALGKSVATLQADLPILDLPKSIKDAYEKGVCPKAVAVRLTQLPDENFQLRAWKRAKAGKDAKEGIAKIEAYLKRRKGDGNKQLLLAYDEDNPTWRKDAMQASQSLFGAVNRFDQTEFANGKMRQIVMAQLKDFEKIELTAKAMMRLATHLQDECRTVKAEGHMRLQKKAV